MPVNVPLADLNIGTLTKYGQRPVDEDQVDKIREEALRSATAPLPACGAVTFKATKDEIMAMGPVRSEPHMRGFLGHTNASIDKIFLYEDRNRMLDRRESKWCDPLP